MKRIGLKIKTILNGQERDVAWWQDSLEKFVALDPPYLWTNTYEKQLVAILVAQIQLIHYGIIILSKLHGKFDAWLYCMLVYSDRTFAYVFKSNPLSPIFSQPYILNFQLALTTHFIAFPIIFRLPKMQLILASNDKMLRLSPILKKRCCYLVQEWAMKFIWKIRIKNLTKQ